MKTIWKFPLPTPNDVVTVEMPKGAKVLCVQLQNDSPCLWALVDPKKPLVKRRFRWVGTGHPIEPEFYLYDYVGTFQVQGGALVFHLFDMGG